MESSEAWSTLAAAVREWAWLARSPVTAAVLVAQARSLPQLACTSLRGTCVSRSDCIPARPHRWSGRKSFPSPKHGLGGTRTKQRKCLHSEGEPHAYLGPSHLGRSPTST